MPFRIAVSGGIAAGKSTVCRVLVENGAVIIDADIVARELVAPGQPALAEIIAQFGNTFCIVLGHPCAQRRLAAIDGYPTFLDQGIGFAPGTMPGIGNEFVKPDRHRRYGPLLYECSVISNTSWPVGEPGPGLLS